MIRTTQGGQGDSGRGSSRKKTRAAAREGVEPLQEVFGKEAEDTSEAERPSGDGSGVRTRALSPHSS